MNDGFYRLINEQGFSMKGERGMKKAKKHVCRWWGIRSPDKAMWELYGCRCGIDRILFPGTVLTYLNRYERLKAKARKEKGHGKA